MLEEGQEEKKKVFLVNLPEEERKMYPEAVQVLETVAAHLAANNNCSSSLKAEFTRLQADTNSQLQERHVKTLHYKALREVLLEQERLGFKLLPQVVVKELLHQLNKAKLKSLPEIFKNLNLSPTLETGTILTKEQSAALWSLVNAQIHKTATQLKPLVEAYSEKEILEKECQTLTEENAGKMAWANQLMDQSNSLLEKLQESTERENEMKAMEVKLLKLKCKCTALKTKLAEIEVLREMYGNEKGEAIRILLQDKTKELEEAKKDNENLINNLDSYQRLPKSEFDPLVQQYQQVLKDIENSEWSLAKMQDKDC